MDEVKDRKQSKFKLIYLMYVLIAFLGFFITKFVFNNFIDKIQVQPKAVEVIKSESASSSLEIVPSEELKIPSPTLKPQLEEPVVETALPQKKLPPILSLSGIFFDEKQPYALINNQIVKQGDIIEGAKVVRILSSKVDLDWEGIPLELKASR